MQMFIVVTYDNQANEPEVMCVNPFEGMVLVPAKELGIEEQDQDDLLAFISEGPSLPQLFPKREWAEAIKDDLLRHYSSAVVVEVDIKL